MYSQSRKAGGSSFSSCDGILVRETPAIIKAAAKITTAAVRAKGQKPRCRLLNGNNSEDSASARLRTDEARLKALSVTNAYQPSDTIDNKPPGTGQEGQLAETQTQPQAAREAFRTYYSNHTAASES